MDKIFFTVTGTKHRYGHKFMEKDMKVHLVKEPDNDYDKEAIKVEVEGLGHIGYVANNPYTVVGECMSAGRIYDRIGDEADGTVLYNIPQGLICTVDMESIIHS